MSYMQAILCVNANKSEGKKRKKNVNSNLAANGAFDLQLPDEFPNGMNNLF